MTNERELSELSERTARQYGPISAEQIRQWIGEGRIESRTPVFTDGAKDWTFAGLLPEFANCFPATAAPPTIAPPAQPRRSNTLATAGLVCGILAWVCCCGFPLNLLGLVFSLIALSQINRHPEFNESRSVAIIGLVLSILSLLFSVGIVLWSMATDNFHLTFNNGWNLKLNHARATAIPSAKDLKVRVAGAWFFCDNRVGRDVPGSGRGGFFLQSEHAWVLSHLPVSRTDGLELSGLRRDAVGLRTVARPFRNRAQGQRAFCPHAARGCLARRVVGGQKTLQKTNRTISAGDSLVVVAGSRRDFHGIAEPAGVCVSLAVAQKRKRLARELRQRRVS